MRPFLLIVLTLLLFSCNREVEFDAILVEGPAPQSVQANIAFNNSEPPFEVTVSPTAIGATAFEVLSGLPGDNTPILIGIQKEVMYLYPESDETFFVTIRAIAPNGKVTEQLFEVIPPADPCTQIFSMPATWDNGNIAFSFGFNGVDLATVQNPDPSGANPEVSNVLQITQDGGGNFDGFGVQMNGPIDFSSDGENDDKIVRLKFWSDTQIPVRLTVQQDPNNNTEREAEVNLIHTGTGWEELRFDFATATAGFTGSGALGIPDFTPFTPTGQYIRFQMFISPGDDVSGTFYLDDVGVCP
ncbi:hypothetical protein H7U19_02065 [Hyunsoonleella sp. SJ7]|uniref:Uncharacterized protein n=1 Tax=Hyunsoonleella aquatilis TaxID=2762758 RepID=A0A923H6L6_9FLAO|nr:hypothetical protein [Hyunsoonleella aquatilis]MBC3757171.1 hypothetical protein [Hyunsoonleella aquatilis]